jgi:hypothetical protein
MRLWEETTQTRSISRPRRVRRGVVKVTIRLFSLNLLEVKEGEKWSSKGYVQAIFHIST